MNQQRRGHLVHQPANLPQISPEDAPKAFANITEYFPPDKFTTIKPTQQLTPANMKGMKPNIKVLDLSPHVYPQSDNLALTKSGLLLLADAYDVKIIPKEKDLQKDFVMFSFEASMVRNGVTVVGYPGTQKIDADDEAEAIRLDMEDKALESEQRHRFQVAQGNTGIPDFQTGHIYAFNNYYKRWVDKGHWERCARKEILRMRKNMVRNCETKAMLAALRNLLGIKAIYSKEEIQKPFVVFYLEPDYSQMSPDQIRAMYMQANHASLLLSGQPIQAQQNQGDRIDANHAYVQEQPQQKVYTDDTSDTIDDAPLLSEGETFDMPYDEDMHAIDAELEEIEAEFEATAEPPLKPHPTQAPASPPPVQQSQQDDTCQMCKVKISITIQKFCQSNHIPPLCMSCQPKYKAQQQ